MLGIHIKKCSVLIHVVDFHPIFSKEGKDALFRAAKEGDIDAVRRQLTGHVSVNSQDKVDHIVSCDITPK